MSFEVSFNYLVMIMSVLIYLMILETDKTYLAQEKKPLK